MTASDVTRRRSTAPLAFAWTGAAVLSMVSAWWYYDRQPPYFGRPATVVDHVDVVPHAAHDALLLIPRVEPLLPRGVEVTCFRPRDGRAWDDHVNYLTAVGLLPHQLVLPPFTAGPEHTGSDAIEYVIAVGAPFDHPSYVPVAGFANGFLYRRK